MTVPALLAHAADWWNAYYGDHRVLSVTIRFLHLAGLIVGGGTALATDRQVLRSARGVGLDRQTALALVRTAHRVVVPGLVVVAITGALMTLADAATFLGSRLFWTKMALVALLALNGALLVSGEASAAGLGGAPARWTRLTVASGVSVVLWLSILLAGTWLTVAA